MYQCENYGKFAVEQRDGCGYACVLMRKYHHVVKENRMNPVTGQMSRWLIETINTGMALNPTEVVETEMIEPTGFDVKNLHDFL